jgi:hypothetical protein
MVGIYINGNGKYQSVLDSVMSGSQVNTRTRNTLIKKLDIYKNFYSTGYADNGLVQRAKAKYHVNDNIEMAVAAYVEDDMNKFLKRIQIRYGL